MAFGLIYGQGAGDSSVAGLAADPSGNVYLLADVQTGDPVDFDPGPGTVDYGDEDRDIAVLARYDANGNLDWSRFVAAADEDSDAAGQAVAADDFFVVLSASLEGSVVIDAGGGDAANFSTDVPSYLLVRYDRTGALNWITAPAAVTERIVAADVAIDATGAVLAAGRFRGSVDFELGTADNAIDSGSFAAFVAKYDFGGAVQWVVQTVDVGAGDDDFAQAVAIAVDGAGNAYVAGHFEGEHSFGGSALIDPIDFTSSVLLSKISPDGSVIWATSAGKASAADVAADGSGNVYVTGTFYGTVDFDPGTGALALTGSSGQQYFLAKYDGDGEIAWARTASSAELDSFGDALDVDDAGNVYVTGYVTGTLDLSTGGPPAVVTNQTSGQLFLARYSPDGNLAWARSVDDAPVPERTRTDAIDVAAGRIFVAGEFETTADFDPGPATALAVSPGFTDKHFVAVYAPGGTLVKEDIPPDQPVITGFSTDDGEAGDFVTTDRTLTIFGTAEPGAEIHVVRDGAAIGDTVAGGNGAWSFVDPAMQSLGFHRWQVTAEDAAGNVSAPSAQLGVLVAGTGTPGSGNDALVGNDASNQIQGGLGNDSIGGAGGNDTVRGNDGHDYLNGGSGSDRLEGDNGNDLAYGGASNDSLYGGNGKDSLFGGNGNDRLEGGAEADWAGGGDGADTVFGGPGADTLFGADGSDRLFGEADADRIILNNDDARDSIYGTIAHLSDDTIDAFLGGLPGDPGVDVIVIQGLSLANAKKLDGDGVHGSLSLADVGGGTLWLTGVAGNVDTMLGGGGEVLIYIY